MFSSEPTATNVSWLIDLKNEIKYRHDIIAISEFYSRKNYVDSLLNISDVLSMEIFERYTDASVSDNVVFIDSSDEYNEYVRQLAHNGDAIYKKLIESRVDSCTQLLILILNILKHNYSEDVAKLIKRLVIRVGKANYLPTGYTNV